MDPNTLSLDPDPEIWSNLDLDPGGRGMSLILKEKFKNNFREKQLS